MSEVNCYEMAKPNTTANTTYPMVPLSKAVSPVERPEVPEVGKKYRQIGVKLWGEGAYQRESIDGGQTQYKTLSRVEADDIIVNKIWARNGSVAVVSNALGGCYGSNEFPTFTPAKDELEPRWFHWLTKTRFFWNQCDEKSRGTSGQNRIRPEKFLEIMIPLPPIVEQRRIVARVEELTGKVEEARGLRSVALEEAALLLNSALVQTFDQQMKVSGWEAKPLKQAAEFARGKFTHRPRNEPRFYGGEIPFIQIGDISNSNRYIRQYTQTLNEDGLKISRLFPVGTVVIAITGATIGVTGILTFESCFPDSIVGITPLQDKVTPEFLHCAVNYTKKVALEGTTQTTQPNMNLKDLERLTIPVPPLSEQHRIVAYLNELQVKVDGLKQLQAETEAELNALLPSILDKAFKGEL